MDALSTAANDSPEEAALARTSLGAIVSNCEHVLGERIAKRFSTRDSLKALEKRCRTLLEQPDEDRAWREEFGKIVETANAVFDQVIREAETVANA